LGYPLGMKQTTPPVRKNARAALAGLAVFCGGTFGLLPAAAANAFKAMAKEFSQAAKVAGINRVAVVPFMPADGGAPAHGWNISERFLTQLVRAGRVKAVERSLLGQLVSEHRLGETGMLDRATLKRLGRILAVDGIVAGSFVSVGQGVLLYARLINTETGVIVAAGEARVKREWPESAGQEVRLGQPPALVPSWPSPAPPPPICRQGLGERGTACAAPLEREAPPAMERSADLKDVPADVPCARAEAEVDRLESRILDLKARYWAIQLRRGVSIADLVVFPGLTISDLDLRQTLFDRMHDWYAQGKIPDLTPEELQRFLVTDMEAFLLHRRCVAPARSGGIQ